MSNAFIGSVFHTMRMPQTAHARQGSRRVYVHPASIFIGPCHAVGRISERELHVGTVLDEKRRRVCLLGRIRLRDAHLDVAKPQAIDALRF